MAKNLIPITEASAVNVAEWHVRNLSQDAATPALKRMAMKAALAGGNVGEIVSEVYKLGFTISADKNNPHHQQMLAAGSIIEDKA